MAIVQMQRVNIFGLKTHRKAILERIQTWGLMEVDITLDNESFHTDDTMASRQKFERQAQQFEQALELLNRYAPEKKGLLSSLAGREPMELERYEQMLQQRKPLVEKAKQILERERKIAEARAAVVKLEAQAESLVPWLLLDVPLGWKNKGAARLLTGSMPGSWTLPELEGKLAELAPELTAYEPRVIWQDKDTTYLSLLCLQDQEQAATHALRALGFAKPALRTDKPPAQAVQDLKAEIARLEKTIAAEEEALGACGEYRRPFELMADHFRIRAEKYEVLGRLPQSRSTFLISGYAPKKEAKELARELEQNYDAAVELEDPPEDADVPVMLKNNSFGQIAEGILASFGLPGKGEIDPSFITACFYVFLFGLMLSDAAYGLIVSLACGFCLLKFPNMERNLRRSIQLFFWCGLSTIFWGVMFSGYFGDVVNVVSRVFFGHEVSVPALWFVPLNNPTKLLVYSMLFGLIHLFTGLAIKGYLCLKNHDVMGFVFDVLCWALMLIGLIIMLLPTDLFYGISQMEFHFPAIVVTIGQAMAVAGAVGILFMSAREKKNFGLRIALGAYDLYNITGWLSDILSYSRLLALGLATGVIAQVVNQMGSMLGGGVFGTILFIIVFLVGHTLNLGINLLGAYVHTCRLQYVEFFGKFYEGTGREFKPFQNNTKYINIREVMNK